ncbi:hypothetical protein D3C72_1957050 [compost metagenome]
MQREFAIVDHGACPQRTVLRRNARTVGGKEARPLINGRRAAIGVGASQSGRGLARYLDAAGARDIAQYPAVELIQHQPAVVDHCQAGIAVGSLVGQFQSAFGNGDRSHSTPCAR